MIRQVHNGAGKRKRVGAMKAGNFIDAVSDRNWRMMGHNDAQMSIIMSADGGLLPGKAGEHLVCARLLMMGLNASLASQGSPYDIMVDFCDSVYRIQVKSSLCPTNVNADGRSDRIAYNFRLRGSGKGGQNKLIDPSVDMFACVALDSGAIDFIAAHAAPVTWQPMPLGGRPFVAVRRKCDKALIGYYAKSIIGDRTFMSAVSDIVTCGSSS